METQENLHSKKLTFSNTCPVPDWMPEQKKEFRKNADVYFKKLLRSTPLFENEDLVVSYFQQGVGSIVAKIELSSGDVYVVKMTETPTRTIAEIKAYEAMSDNDIRVPKVYFEGTVDEHPFLVMEYFDQGTLKDAFEEEKLTLKEVGEVKSEVFVALQKIQGKGYGWPTDYDGEFIVGNFADIDSFMDKWFCNPDTVEIANKYEPSISWGDELRKHSEIIKKQYPEDESNLGSFDFQTAHFFASDPPTFFDANPRLEPEYFDLGYLLMPSVSPNPDDIEMSKMILEKIENTSGQIDREKLLRAVWLQTFRKATNLLLRPNEERIKNGGHMLKMLTDEGLLEKYLEQYFQSSNPA
ncbi:MAG: fructosamine kinase family protein [Candidatus Pacebacteria bacterium]|nr:fructosamine kinase family protein [Candidatus Paceibacterota bacterium]